MGGRKRVGGWEGEWEGEWEGGRGRVGGREGFCLLNRNTSHRDGGLDPGVIASELPFLSHFLATQQTLHPSTNTDVLRSTLEIHKTIYKHIHRWVYIYTMN